MWPKGGCLPMKPPNGWKSLKPARARRKRRRQIWRPSAEFGWTAWRWQDGGRLNIRMNPELPLDVELMAGTLRVRGLRSPIRADVSAGSARVEGFAGPLDLSVATGSVHATGILTGGNSRVRCD